MMTFVPCTHSETCEDCRKKTSLVDNMETLLVPYIREQASKQPDKATRGQVFNAVSVERDYQEYRWPGHRHEIEAYLTYIRKYIDKAEDILTFEGTTDEVLDILRKITALGVASMEEHGARGRVLDDRAREGVEDIAQARLARARNGFFV